MAVQPNDLLPEGENDPLRDEPPAPAPEPVQSSPEPALDEAPQPATEEAPAPELGAEDNWKKRFDDTRELQRRTAEERNEAIRTRDEALRLARQVYENARLQQTQTPTPEGLSPDLAAEAEQLGITTEQLAFIQKLADARARETTGQFEQRYTQDRAAEIEQRVFQQANDAVVNVREQFARAHPDAVEHAEEILEFMQRVGAVAPEPDETGRFPVQIENFSVGDLEAAWEAVQNPDLAMVLKANPDWYYSADGMDWARRQVQAEQQRASLAELLEKAQPVTSPQIDPQRIAALASAETLPATGGPPPTAGGPPQDEFDEAVQMWQGKKKSAFSQ